MYQFIAIFLVAHTWPLFANPTTLHTANITDSAPTRTVVETTAKDDGDVESKSYTKPGRWFGKLYFYTDADGKWWLAKHAYTADKEGKFYDKDKNIISYKKGDILYETSNMGWFKGPANAEVVNTADLAPNPENVEMSDFEKKVIYLTNQQRQRHGLRPLRITQFLMNGARKHSAWMAGGGGLTHTSAGDRAENIAWNQSSPEEVVQSWMNSAGHRANILGNYSTIGVAVQNNGNGPYWTQQFQY